MPEQQVLPPAIAPRGVNGRPLHPELEKRIWRPGQSGNPEGRSGRYGEMQRLCREFSPEGAQVLIGIAGDPKEDARCRIVATQELFNRAWGKPREYDPKAEMPETQAIDPSLLSAAQRLEIRRALEWLIQAAEASAQTETSR